MLNILVVDDDPEIREMVVDNLSLNPNYNVEDAEDGEEALEKCEICLFDMIITDLNMPNMSGLEFSAFVRATTINQSTPIIVISGNMDSHKTDKFLKLGMVEILSKPVTNTELDAVVKKQLESGYTSLAEGAPDPSELCEIIKSGLSSLAKTLEVAEPVFETSVMGHPVFPEAMSTGVIPIFARELYGSFSLSLDEPLLLEFGTSLFGSNQAPRLESCLPIASELSLQLADYYMKRMNSNSHRCAIGVPTQQSGQGHKAKHVFGGPVTSVPFKLGGGHGVMSFAQGVKRLEQ